MTKKQKNLTVGIVILAISLIALLFSEDSSKLISFGDKEIIPKENTYEKEVIIVPTLVVGQTEDKLIVSVSPEVEAEDETVESQSQVNIITYPVVKVVDGDTLDVNINGKVERLRLIGIDTPETVDPRRDVQCFGVEASNKAKELLVGKAVSLESDETQGDRDKYKRLLRYVFLPDGTNFNLYMISEGYAHEYTYDGAYKYQKEFKQAETEARNSNKGLWSPDVCL